ncbi:glycosyltransferase family 8 protein [Pseudovibrio sp. Alg231-02]|uniref:glycosyltransferase family 8 protein n=1 Tax=Pseudovibrio sp. Alg231-02 TaxID=1922223 RepID=UPI000D55AA9D|nr:glycosyltransferase [Pseudovibrio sp. Alg231-02]
MNQNAVYFVTDDKFLGLTLVNARKLSAMRDCTFDVHVFYQGTKALDDLRQGMDIYFHRYELKLPSEVKSSALWPNIVYGRIFVPQMLEQHYDRLLYLDADVFFWRSPQSLFDADLGTSALGAVQDFNIASGGYPRQFPSKATWMEAIGINGNQYFNSGVLLIDTNRWNKIDFHQKLVTFMQYFGSSASMWDQDFLNHVFQSAWQPLSPLANWQYGAVPKNKLEPFNPIITHFVGERKPWHPDWPFDKSYQAYFLEGQSAEIEFPQIHLRPTKTLKLKLEKLLRSNKMKRKNKKIEHSQIEYLQNLFKYDRLKQ